MSADAYSAPYVALVIAARSAAADAGSSAGCMHHMKLKIESARQRLMTHDCKIPVPLRIRLDDELAQRYDALGRVIAMRAMRDCVVRLSPARAVAT